MNRRQRLQKRQMSKPGHASAEYDAPIAHLHLVRLWAEALSRAEAAASCGEGQPAPPSTRRSRTRCKQSHTFPALRNWYCYGLKESKRDCQVRARSAAALHTLMLRSLRVGGLVPLLWGSLCHYVALLQQRFRGSVVALPLNERYILNALFMILPPRPWSTLAVVLLQYRCG